MNSGENLSRYEIEFPGLPLAVYREIAAHLRQVPSVETGLIAQQSQHFDYNQSQVGNLWIEYGETASQASRQRVDKILSYYQQRYGKMVMVNG